MHVFVFVIFERVSDIQSSDSSAIKYFNHCNFSLDQSYKIISLCQKKIHPDRENNGVITYLFV
jgi:hypothetical protein